MNVSVKLFAIAKDLAGRDTVEVPLPDGSNVGDLRRSLGETVPELSDLVDHVLFAIGTDYADDATIIPAGADVVCIPPVSGG